MNQYKRQPDIRDRQIAELEAKLQRAYQVIGNLQKQNLELQKQVEDFGSQENKKSAFISTSENLHFQRQQTIAKQQYTQPHLTKKTYKKKARLRKSPYLKLYRLIALCVLLIIGLLGLGRILAQISNSKNLKSVNNQSVQTPAGVSQFPNAPVQQTNIALDKPYNLPVNISSQLASAAIESIYNVKNEPEFTKSEELDIIVNRIVNYIQDKNLPTEALSVTLIDLNKKAIAGYEQEKLRYPASVVKLFWMAILEARIKQNLIPSNYIYNINADLNDMILKSSNDASSRIVDTISGTYSYEQKLDDEQFKQWQRQRQSLDHFFQKSGYKDISISQKTYPIYYLKFTKPKGADLQFRGDNPNHPKRNQITTYHAARLMYEIFTNQAIGHEYSEKMASLLTRDLHPQAWKKDPPSQDGFNPVENFLGEYLAADADQIVFASKAGWTTTSRQEVAYIATKDGKTRYIIAVFGEDPAYANSANIFPDISRLVFERMRNRT